MVYAFPPKNHIGLSSTFLINSDDQLYRHNLIQIFTFKCLNNKKAFTRYRHKLFGDNKLSKRYALCIGINSIRNAIELSLNFACADAKALAEVLTDKTRGCFQSKIILNEQATREEIRQALIGLLLNPDLKNDDIVLVYFSGHGALDLADNLVLVTNDAKLTESRGHKRFDFTTGYHIKDFEVLLENTKAGTVIFIADACFSGASTKALGRITYKEKANIIFIGACSSRQTSVEMASLNHGLFTSCFLESLALKPTKGEWITLQQILSNIDSKMRLLGTQGIEISTHSINPDILIAKNPLYEVENSTLTNDVKELFDIEGSKIICLHEELPNFFIAEQSRPLSTNRIGITCINNLHHDLTENDIRQFTVKIENYRQQRQIDRGYLITANPISPYLTAMVHNSGVAECYTKEELLGSIIDFHNYLRRIISSFTQKTPGSNEPPLNQFYVDLKATPPNAEKPVDISLIIDQWLNSGSQRLAVLGQYGYGKTAFCKKLAHDLAKSHMDGHSKRIPILLDLGKFPRLSTDIEDIIINHLIRTCGVKTANLDAFRKLNDSGFLLLIFDGLDEMAVRTNKSVLDENMRQISKLASAPENRVIVTCRPEYFWSKVEEDSSFSGYYRTSIARLTPGQVRLFLQRRIPLITEAKRDWRYYYDKIKSIRPLTDLSRRPVFLEMIAETLPQLIQEDKAINRSSLYDTYLRNEISRQKIDNNRELLIDVDKRFQLMRMLAFELFIKKNTDGMDSQEIVQLVSGALNPEQRLHLKEHMADFLTCSFLKRDGTKFSFSHQTILEYLVSEVLFDQIQIGNFRHINKEEMTEPMLDFLGEKTIDGAALLKCVISTRNQGINDHGMLGTNAISLLNRSKYPLAGEDLSNTDIHSAKLKGAELPKIIFDFSNLSDIDLSDSNLTEASFESANLYAADLSKCSLYGAYFSEATMNRINLNNSDLQTANLSNTVITNGSLRAVNMEKANLSNCNLRNADLDKANMVGSNLYGAYLVGANLSGADLSDADIRDTNLRGTILEGTILYGVAFNESTQIDEKDFGCSIDNAFDQGLIDRSLYEYLANSIKLEQEPVDAEYTDKETDRDEFEEP